EPVRWRAEGRPRRAGVSSFGVSGTNAHVILEEPPAAEPKPVAEGEAPVPVGVDLLPWVVSGRDVAGLRAQAAQLAGFVRAQRAAGAVEALLSGLDAVGAGEPAEGVTTGTATPGSAVVFVFPGQGGQWAGMGRELLDSWPVFADRLAVCERALDPFVDWSLREVLTGSDEKWLGRVDVVQPVAGGDGVRRPGRG
uniref:acyltransferase domain-containing protein n=1 Tax=Streptomyces griseus TaxID=1911 RepID=UPI001F3A29A0